ncbi:MAG: asparagine synthetase B family protein, partial [Planctomycetota bacterium]
YVYRGMVDHTTDTFFEGVKLVPAGCTATFDLESKRLAIDRFYDLPLGDRKVSLDEVRDTLRRAVERRLVSDVPVSLSLSGGIDSSAVAALMATSSSDRFVAFSTQSGESRGDETEFVRQLVDRYDNIDLVTNPLAPESFLENYRTIIYHMDSPFGGHIPYVRWEIARTCHENDRKVMLNGEGADELIGGYWISIAFFLTDLFRRGHWRRLAKELRALRGTNELGTVVATFLAMAMLPSGFAIHQTTRQYKKLKTGFGIRIDHGDASAEIRAMKKCDERQIRKRLVTELILPHLLMCNDKMSMANSVESRVPFLDYEFAELALSMASEDLVVGGLRKHPLREAIRGLVPDDILDRKRKDYFSAPTSKYLRDERMGRRIRELFGDARSACFMDPKAVLRQFEAYQHKRSVGKNAILRMLWLEEWMRVFDVAA